MCARRCSALAPDSLEEKGKRAAQGGDSGSSKLDKRPNIADRDALSIHI